MLWQFCSVFSVHGGWTQWTDWQHCNKPCNSGRQQRQRWCINPIPTYNGQPCHGANNQSVICNSNLCPSTLYFDLLIAIWQVCCSRTHLSLSFLGLEKSLSDSWLTPEVASLPSEVLRDECALSPNIYARTGSCHCKSFLVASTRKAMIAFDFHLLAARVRLENKEQFTPHWLMSIATCINPGFVLSYGDTQFVQSWI